jgi:uncharacterized damage-inducible protein DinB
MKSFFKELLDYNFSMNEKLIEKFKEHPEFPEKSTRLFNHILSAHHIWNHRILNDKARLSVWPDILEQEYQKINFDNHKFSLGIIENKDLEMAISYTNSKGDTFSNSGKDILFHIVNHSNYHRAQIASNLKEVGIDPIISDYIFYKR